MCIRGFGITDVRQTFSTIMSDQHNPVWRLLQLCLVATAALVAVGETPNFVVLFIDDMGLNQVSVPTRGNFYGYTGVNGTISTPNIAKLAAEGLLFQTWYSSFHLCSPSRASMMTGRYSVRSGIGIPPDKYAPHAPGPNARGKTVFSGEAIGGLPLNETTTAEALRGAGYATHMVGKWHLGTRREYMPTSRGFDTYLGIPFSQDMGPSFWAPGPAVEPMKPTPIPLVKNDSHIIEQPVDLSTLAQRYASSASSFITEQAAAKRPFYLYVPFNHIHQPNSCGPDFCGRSSRGPIGDAVEEVDWAIGQIMAALQHAGVDDNTLVIFTSDNGAPAKGDPAGNKPLRGYKGQVWEGGFRMPGIARWPGRITPGTMSRAIVSTLDIHPTLLTIADVPLPTDRIMDGMDLSPILFQGSQAGHKCFFFYHNAVAANAENELWAARCGDYKAYWSVNDKGPGWKPGLQNPPLMFNLVEDPGESAPIDNATDLYKNVLKEISDERAKHIATLDVVPDQMGRGNSNVYAFCSDPTSKPINCTMNPENWKPQSICQTPACLNSNKVLAKGCANTTF